MRSFLRQSGIFVLGMVAGSIIYNAIWHTSYNALWMHNQDLRIQLDQAEEDNETLRKHSNRHSVIKEIKVRAEQSSADKISAIEVKDILRQMHEDLEVLRGRDIFEIDTDSKMVRVLLNRKIYTVREKEYSIQVKTMLAVEGVLQIWVEMHPYIRS